MKRILLRRKQVASAIPKYTAPLLLILLTIWIFGLLSGVTRIQTEALSLTPLLDDANGWNIDTVENGRRRAVSTEEILEMEYGRVIYFSRLLTKEQEEKGYTFLSLDYYRPCAVFLDGELLYTNCPLHEMRMDTVSFPKDYAPTPPAPGEYVRCSLPAHFAGRRLTIATTLQAPYMPGILLFSYRTEAEELIAHTGGELMSAAGYAVVALLLSGIWLFAFFQGIHDYPSLLLILAALVQVLSHLRQFTFFTPSSYAIDNPLAVCIPAVEVLLPLAFLLLQMKERTNRLVFGGILAVSAVFSLISLIGGQFGDLPFFSYFLGLYLYLFCPLAALLFFAVREAIHGKNRLFILLLYGLCVAVCLIAALCAVSSLWGGGAFANEIAAMFSGLRPPITPALFFYWCAVILFALSAFLALYQIIRRIAVMRTDLALQTEHARQLYSRLSAQRDFYEARLAHEDALRSLRHDMAGHLNTLATLLQDEKTAEAKNYLEGVTKYNKEQVSEIFSQNPYINAVLQNYASKCNKQHTELVCHIGIGDVELPVTELCLILNNALENALEGSQTIPEGERLIKVQAAVRQNQFLLRVSNRFDGRLKTADGLPVSTKEGEGHGYGLSNIKQAAERRNGHMEYHVQDEYFVLDVTFGAE